MRPPIGRALARPRTRPVEIIDKLNKEINAALADPTIKTRFAELGGAPLMLSPVDFGKLVAAETEKWAKVIRAANIMAERPRSEQARYSPNFALSETANIQSE